MCGRYDNLIARDAYATLFRTGRIPRSNFPPRYNIAPTDQIPIVRMDPRDGEREHDRMPVMLMAEDYGRWLGPDTAADELRAMLRPYDAALMEAYAVSRTVNSVKNDTAECIKPIDDQA
jgi:putative SOS response-associated peptidase YedK